MNKFSKLPSRTPVATPVYSQPMIPQPAPVVPREVVKTDAQRSAMENAVMVGSKNGVSVGLVRKTNTVGEGSSVFTLILDGSTATTDSELAIGGIACQFLKAGFIDNKDVFGLGDIDPLLSDNDGVELSKLVRFGMVTSRNAVIIEKINVQSDSPIQLAQDMTLRSFTYDAEYKDQKLNIQAGVSLYGERKDMAEVVNTNGDWIVGGNQTIVYRVKAGSVATLNFYIAGSFGTDIATF